MPRSGKKGKAESLRKLGSCLLKKMEKFIICGEQSLEGEVKIMGAKNAATPILAATLLTKEPCVIDNLPLVGDVLRMIEILESLGVKTQWLSKRKLWLQAKNLSLQNLRTDLVCQLRSSVLVIGSLLARLGRVTLPCPGGCLIGARPLDTHLDAFQSLGVEVKERGEKYEFQVKEKRKSFKTCQVVLREFSVTATENILMFAASCPQQTIIRLAAAEPHVQDLCQFLTKLGAQIEGIGTHTLRVNGTPKLKGVSYHKIIPDNIEAATFIIAAAATRGRIKIKEVILDHLWAILKKLEEMGVKIEITPSKKGFHDIIVSPAPKLKAARIQTLPYPGLATDIQAPFGVLATQATGMSLIHDPLYEGRLRYVTELNKMGANCLVADPHRAFIIGPTPLYGREITSFDIRAGATLIIAGLIAKGETTIKNAYQVDRGYERIEKRLQKLGAKIKRSTNQANNL